MNSGVMNPIKEWDLLGLHPRRSRDDLLNSIVPNGLRCSSKKVVLRDGLSIVNPKQYWPELLPRLIAGISNAVRHGKCYRNYYQAILVILNDSDRQTFIQIFVRSLGIPSVLASFDIAPVHDSWCIVDSVIILTIVSKFYNDGRFILYEHGVTDRLSKLCRRIIDHDIHNAAINLLVDLAVDVRICQEIIDDLAYNPSEDARFAVSSILSRTIDTSTITSADEQLNDYNKKSLAIETYAPEITCCAKISKTYKYMSIPEVLLSFMKSAFVEVKTIAIKICLVISSEPSSKINLFPAIVENSLLNDFKGSRGFHESIWLNQTHAHLFRCLITYGNFETKYLAGEMIAVFYDQYDGSESLVNVLGTLLCLSSTSDGEKMICHSPWSMKSSKDLHEDNSSDILSKVSTQNKHRDSIASVNSTTSATTTGPLGDYESKLCSIVGICCYSLRRIIELLIKSLEPHSINRVYQKHMNHNSQWLSSEDQCGGFDGLSQASQISFDNGAEHFEKIQSDMNLIVPSLEGNFKDPPISDFHDSDEDLTDFQDNQHEISLSEESSLSFRRKVKDPHILSLGNNKAIITSTSAIEDHMRNLRSNSIHYSLLLLCFTHIQILKSYHILTEYNPDMIKSNLVSEPTGEESIFANATNVSNISVSDLTEFAATETNTGGSNTNGSILQSKPPSFPRPSLTTQKRPSINEQCSRIAGGGSSRSAPEEDFLPGDLCQLFRFYIGKVVHGSSPSKRRRNQKSVSGLDSLVQASYSSKSTGEASSMDIDVPSVDVLGYHLKILFEVVSLLQLWCSIDGQALWDIRRAFSDVGLSTVDTKNHMSIDIVETLQLHFETPPEKRSSSAEGSLKMLMNNVRKILNITDRVIFLRKSLDSTIQDDNYSNFDMLGQPFDTIAFTNSTNQDKALLRKISPPRDRNVRIQLTKQKDSTDKKPQLQLLSTSKQQANQNKANKRTDFDGHNEKLIQLFQRKDATFPDLMKLTLDHFSKLRDPPPSAGESGRGESRDGNRKSQEGGNRKTSGCQSPPKSRMEAAMEQRRLNKIAKLLKDSEVVVSPTSPKTSHLKQRKIAHQEEPKKSPRSPRTDRVKRSMKPPRPPSPVRVSRGGISSAGAGLQTIEETDGERLQRDTLVTPQSQKRMVVMANGLICEIKGDGGFNRGSTPSTPSPRTASNK